MNDAFYFLAAVWAAEHVALALLLFWWAFTPRTPTQSPTHPTYPPPLKPQNPPMWTVRR